MTGRKRLVAAARGNVLDPKPQIASIGRTSDADVVPDSDSVSSDGARAVLVEVLSPFGQALQRGDDPETAILDELIEETRGAMRDALDAGADGIMVRLHGATGKTYMRYREHDRALLEEIADARLNVLFAVHPFELDLVKDLPAHVFAWDVVKTGIDSATIRASRPGAQASSDPASEITLVAPWAEGPP